MIYSTVIVTKMDKIKDTYRANRGNKYPLLHTQVVYLVNGQLKQMPTFGLRLFS